MTIDNAQFTCRSLEIVPSALYGPRGRIPALIRAGTRFRRTRALQRQNLFDSQPLQRFIVQLSRYFQALDFLEFPHGGLRLGACNPVNCTAVVALLLQRLLSRADLLILRTLLLRTGLLNRAVPFRLRRGLR